MTIFSMASAGFFLEIDLSHETFKAWLHVIICIYYMLMMQNFDPIWIKLS